MKAIACIALAFFLRPAQLNAQELVSNDLEKGYVKNGLKYLVWDYFDENKELQLKINHTTGKVYFLKEDTTAFVINHGGHWVRRQLRVYPIPIEGYQNFYKSISRSIRYPAAARRMGIDGDVYVLFEIDTLGLPANYLVLRDIGAGCGEEIIRALRENEVPWVPAQLDQRAYSSRFILPVSFALGERPRAAKHPELALARMLQEVAITAFGVERSVVSGYPPVLAREPGHAAIVISKNRHALPGYISPEPFYSLDDALLSGKKVERLSLTHQDLSELSANISKLDDLEFLDLEGNALNVLPKEIGKLEKLQELYAPENWLKDLPPDLASLKSLKVLALASNQFTEFPEEICGCTNLEVLDIGDNKITQIPPCISQLKKLEIIGLQNNQLTTLPDGFFALKKLKTIHLKDNPLDPAVLGRIKSTFPKAELVTE